MFTAVTLNKRGLSSPVTPVLVQFLKLTIVLKDLFGDDV